MVRAYPFSWDFGFIWPPETEESEENLTYARAVLEACLPPVALASPEPPEQPIVYEYRDDDRPEWLGIRTILRERMPYARHVTAERMADAKAECARRSIDTTDFEEIWTRRVIAWIAEQTLYWCGLMVDDEKALTPGSWTSRSCMCDGGWPARRAWGRSAAPRPCPRAAPLWRDWPRMRDYRTRSVS